MEKWRKSVAEVGGGGAEAREEAVNADGWGLQSTSPFKHSYLSS